MHLLSPIEIPDAAPMKEEGLAVLTRAQALARITTNEEYESAGAELVRVTRGEKSVLAAFEPAARAADEAHKTVTKLRGDLASYFTKAKDILKRGMSEYLIEEDRRRRVEQARLQEIERHKAQEAQIAEAVALDQAGEGRAADQVLAAPLVAPVIELAKPIAVGVSSRKKYRFEIIDQSQIARAFLVPDESKIQKLVDSLGPDAGPVVGGIKVWEDRVISARA